MVCCRGDRKSGGSGRQLIFSIGFLGRTSLVSDGMSPEGDRKGVPGRGNGTASAETSGCGEQGGQCGWCGGVGEEGRWEVRSDHAATCRS